MLLLTRGECRVEHADVEPGRRQAFGEVVDAWAVPSPRFQRGCPDDEGRPAACTAIRPLADGRCNREKRRLQHPRCTAPPQLIADRRAGRQPFNGGAEHALRVGLDDGGVVGQPSANGRRRWVWCGDNEPIGGDGRVPGRRVRLSSSGSVITANRACVCSVQTTSRVVPAACSPRISSRRGTGRGWRCGWRWCAPPMSTVLPTRWPVPSPRGRRSGTGRAPVRDPQDVARRWFEVVTGEDALRCVDAARRGGVEEGRFAAGRDFAVPVPPGLDVARPCSVLPGERYSSRDSESGVSW